MNKDLKKCLKLWDWSKMNFTYFSHKVYVLKRDLKEKGVGFTFKRIILFLFRPFYYLVKRNRALIEFFYGTLPKLRQKLPVFKIDSGFLKFPKSDLVERVRYFWYANIPGDFDLDGEKISRRDIFVYGGPNPKFTCPICQKSEWLSRIRQKNLFQPHNCPQAKECEILCSRQGDELWTNFHQNFDFSIGCDPNLPAPKCLIISPQDKNSIGGGFYQRFKSPRCEQWMRVFRRKLAFACQADIIQNPVQINFSNYDFVFVPNIGLNWKFPRPPLPVIMYSHDFWPLEDKSYQWMIDWLKPEILLTPYPTQWKEYFKLPQKTKVVFYPFFDSLFFARPNLNNKKLDLLVIGALSSPVYGPRISLNEKISQVSKNYKIEFFHLPGVFSAEWEGPVYYLDPITKSSVYYLNKWSEYLGSARYVIFGRMKFPILVSKYYEVLGSGAIPIFPEVPDLKLLGVKPFEHYIPLSEIEDNPERLTYFLDQYDDFKHIAQNAVNWYKKVSDRMIFDDFEELIREITKYKYQKRLI